MLSSSPARLKPIQRAESGGALATQIKTPGESVLFHQWRAKVIISISTSNPNSVDIKESNFLLNTNFNIFKVLSIYITWDGLSQKTISRYCLFKDEK